MKEKCTQFFLIGVICQMLFGGLCADDNMQIKGEVNRETRGTATRREEVPTPELLDPPLSGREGWPGGHSPRAQITVINLRWSLPGRGASWKHTAWNSTWGLGPREPPESPGVAAHRVTRETLSHPFSAQMCEETPPPNG